MRPTELFEKALCGASAGICIRHDVPMSEYTSFRVGGTVPLMAIPSNEEEAALCVKAAVDSRCTALWVGNGTNLLFEDGRLDFAVIHTGQMRGIEVKGNTVEAMCGASMAAAAAAARDASLQGLEFAHGIPGSLGGGVFMNAGAYGSSLSDRVSRSLCADPSGELVCLDAGSHGFSYRHSSIMDNGYTVLRTTLELEPGDRGVIAEKMAELRQRRQSSQPLDMPSAGSTFKRPPEGYAAALIEQAGLKGCRLGGAQVSEKHAGFIVNRGGATFADITGLMRLVRQRVYENSGVMLENEVQIINREGRAWNF